MFEALIKQFEAPVSGDLWDSAWGVGGSAYGRCSPGSSWGAQLATGGVELEVRMGMEKQIKDLIFQNCSLVLIISG